MRILLSIATAITILAVALLLMMTPQWMHYALRGPTAPYFATPQMAFDLSDRTISELFFGPGTFSRFGGDEASHMRDVRVVLYGFLVVAAASLVFVVASLVSAPRDAARWRAVARGGIGLVIVLIVIGVFAFVAFDTAFLLFHELFFPGGNFSFGDDSLLIRLYPQPFWEVTAGALGIVGALGGLAVWAVARARAADLSAA